MDTLNVEAMMREALAEAQAAGEAGEYPIGLEMVNAHVAISRALGAPVRWVPLDAVTTTLQVAGLTKDAPHPHAGQLFLDSSADAYNGIGNLTGSTNSIDASDFNQLVAKLGERP